MAKRLIILGAGVDRTTGIDFPLANTLLADLACYIEGPGKGVDIALRNMLPGLRFKFNTIIARAVDKITSREHHEQKEMVGRLREAIKNLNPEQVQTRKLGELIILLFEKLAIIAEHSLLDTETEDLIRSAFPNNADDLIDSDSILDMQKISLSDTFKRILKQTLKDGLTADPNPVAWALSSDMLNIETLLVEKFLGFYNNNASEVRNYIYISWVLWAFLVTKQQEVLSKNRGNDLPFYSLIPTSTRAITLNYTAFIEQKLDRSNIIYFHGGLTEYIRMDTRDLMPIEEILECDPADFIRDIIAPNIDINIKDFHNQRHVIPSLVPPLRLKPILSNHYIDVWSKASAWVKDATHIIVLGYSFNNADEHFNDILRCNSDRKIDIVVPEANTTAFKNRMEKVFNIPASQFNTVKIKNHTALQFRQIRLIPAKASEIDLATLFDLT